MPNPDAFAPLGDPVFDYEGEPRVIRRDFDCLDIPPVTLSPSGVRSLERRIAGYWNELARYRLRTVDIGALGVDLDECRDLVETLTSICDGADPRNLERVDWVALGARLERLTSFGGYGKLGKLHALLMADETPAEATS
jgi:hypothetical protein